MKKLTQILFFFLLITQTYYPQWFQQTSGITSNLTDVYFMDTNYGIAVGDSYILKTTNGGTTWTVIVNSGPYANYTGVCVIDTNNITVLGYDHIGFGFINKSTDGGTTWNTQYYTSGIYYYDVCFINADTGTVVGAGLTILKTTNGGTTWIEQTYTPGGGTLFGVSFTDANIGTAIGGNFSGYGVIVRTTNGGTTWTEQSYGTTNQLFGISFTDANTGTAVGEFGIILRTTNGGTNWISQWGGTTKTLMGVSFTDANNGTAVGESGTILRTTNGGAFWIVQLSGTTNNLRSVYFTDADTGTAVGVNGTILRTIDSISLDLSLVAYYPFNGNTNDESGYGNHGTGYSPFTSDRFNVQERACEFYWGTGINCGDPINNILDLGINSTINVWATGLVGVILSKDFGPGNYNKWYLSASSGVLSFNIHDSSSGTTTELNSNFFQYEPYYWYNVCVVKERLIYSFYINGLPAGVDTSSIEVPTVDGPLSIGHLEPFAYFYGKLDDIRLYNRALPQEEIDSLYHLGGWPPIFFQLSLDITDTWNMVSIPGLHPTDQNVSTWWPGLTGTVWGYNGVQYVTKTIATPGEGYWMKHVGDTVYNYPAIQIVPHSPILAVSGWNMIGGYENNATTTEIETNPPNQITGTIWGYNGVQYVAANSIVPGYSYWVKLLPGCPCTITLPEVFAKGNEVVEIFKEDWGRIILTDAAGISSTLYAVKGEVDLDQYEMPPMPPSGTFDIRFLSGRIAEDLNSAIQTIQMSGVVYPLTVRVEGMDIRLMDETGKTINLNLKSGEDVVINDATIRKLMVSGETIPTVYALEQNYPNPFNPSTKIEFSLPEDVSNVKLSIYNALGEKVAELVNTALTAGKYSYQWNAQNVATGMYIYELRTDKFVSVKKMVLIK